MCIRDSFWYSTALLVKKIFFCTVQQKWRFELQKQIKPYGFIGFSRRRVHFIGTVQQKWSFVRKRYQKQYVFMSFCNSKLHFAILYCSEALSLTYPLRKQLITDWSCSEALAFTNPSIKAWSGLKHFLSQILYGKARLQTRITLSLRWGWAYTLLIQSCESFKSQKSRAKWSACGQRYIINISLIEGPQALFHEGWHREN